MRQVMGSIPLRVAANIYFAGPYPQGAMAGGLSSMALMAWIVVGAQTAIASKELQFPWLPTRVDGCVRNFTESLGDKDMMWT